MDVENSLKSKVLYKLTLIILKILPMIMSISYLIMLILFNTKESLVIIPHIIDTVLAPLVFLYLTSYVFRFCAFHRIFIHYYAFITILNVTDHYFCNYLNENVVTFIHDIGTIIFIILTIIMYLYKKSCIFKIK